ncbi:hypothetical protein BGW41_007206 [Actinomortierella wolfii]|nr:hypothetical protein BGW41_007206 [Actinomortierella wolfii]
MAFSFKLKSKSSPSTSVNNVGSVSSTPRSSLSGDGSILQGKTLIKTQDVYRISAYALAQSRLKSNTSASSSATKSQSGSAASTPRSSIDGSSSNSKALSKSSNIYHTSSFALANSRL